MLKTFIDANAIGYSAHSAKNKLSDGIRDTTAIFNSLNSMRHIIDKRSASRPVVLWDGRSWRHKAYSEYKANRDRDPKMAAERDSYKLARPHISRGLKFLGVTQAIAPNYEADDLAALLTRMTVKAGGKVMLITGDKDWLQILDKGVSWYDHVRKRTCTFEEFSDFTGCADREQFVSMKALAGDIGDNIKGVKGIGEGAARELFQAWGTVDNFLAEPLDQVEVCYKTTLGKNFPKKLRDFHQTQELRDQYYHDLALVDLYGPSVPRPDRIVVTKSQIDVDGFYKFCGEFGFASIMRNMSDWLRPFEIATANWSE